MNNPRPAPLGAKLLRDHIDRLHEGNVSAFCRSHNLDRVHILRVLSGERSRINPDLVRDLDQATKGAVPWWSWTTDGRAPERPVGADHTANDFTVPAATQRPSGELRVERDSFFQVGG